MRRAAARLFGNAPAAVVGRIALNILEALSPVFRRPICAARSISYAL